MTGCSVRPNGFNGLLTRPGPQKAAHFVESAKKHNKRATKRFSRWLTAGVAGRLGGQWMETISDYQPGAGTSEFWGCPGPERRFSNSVDREPGAECFD